MPHATYESFYEHKQLLFGIAYRMLSTINDAEDILQEVFIDWHTKVEHGLEIDSPRAYLASMVTHKAIDHLRQAYVQRETYPGTWLAEPIVTNNADEFLDRMILKENISIAWLLVLERLSPLERAVYVLRVVFDFDYKTISRCVGKAPSYCRKIMERARQHIRDCSTRYDISSEQHASILQAFLKAANTGDVDTLLEILLPDSTFIADGGGQVVSALRPVYGAERIVRFLLGVQKKTTLPIDYKIVLINGEYGIIASYGGMLLYAMAVSFRDNRIAAIHNIRNPYKLAHVPHVG